MDLGCGFFRRDKWFFKHKLPGPTTKVYVDKAHRERGLLGFSSFYALYSGRLAGKIGKTNHDRRNTRPVDKNPRLFVLQWVEKAIYLVGGCPMAELECLK
jgi:hypothetical protein